MSKLISLVTSIFVGLVALASVGPTLVAVLHALVPVIVVVGVVVGLLRALFYFTNRW